MPRPFVRGRYKDVKKEIMPERILLIDDEKDLVKLVVIRLEAAGYEVITAYGGQEGLDKAKIEKPNLILLDIMMPGMDGFEVLHKLKNDTETVNIPVIMLTAKGESQSLFAAQDLKATDYIIKPFETEELLRLVKRYS